MILVGWAKLLEVRYLAFLSAHKLILRMALEMYDQVTNTFETETRERSNRIDVFVIGERVQHA